MDRDVVEAGEARAAGRLDVDPDGSRRADGGQDQTRCAAEADVHDVVLDERLTVARAATPAAASADREDRPDVPGHEVGEQPVRGGGLVRRPPADAEAAGAAQPTRCRSRARTEARQACSNSRAVSPLRASIRAYSSP